MRSCYKCGESVDLSAKTCPHCGFKQPQKLGKLGWLILIVLVITGLSYCSGNDKNTTKPVPSEVVQNSPWDGSVVQVENYLRQTLNDPDSYQSVNWGKVMKRDDGGFFVRHSFRAKNAFGALILQDYVFVLDSAGQIVSAKRVE